MAKRAPCNTSPIRVGVGGGCYQHKKTSEMAIPVFENVTKAKDYALTPDPAGITPYPTPSSVAFWPTCAEYPSDCEPPDPPCGEWKAGQIDGGTAWAPEMGMPAGTGTPTDLNYYSDTETTIDVSTCRKIGHKVVQAAKFWHGMHGFKSEYWQAATHVTNDGSCNPAVCRAQNNTPDQTKYLTLSGECTMKLFSGEPGHAVTFENSLSQTISVNSLSGVRTITAQSEPDPCATWGFPNRDSWGYFTDDPPSGFITVYDLLSRVASMTLATANGTNSIGGQFVGIGGAYANAGDKTCSGVLWSSYFNATTANENFPGDLEGQLMSQVENDFAGTCRRRNYALVRFEDDDPIAELHEDITLEITNTTLVWDYKQYSLDGDNEVYLSAHYHAEVSLSDPYTSEQVCAEVVALADEWDLSDDKVLPWRDDGYLSVGPLVTRNEVQAAVAPVFVFPALIPDTDLPITDCNELDPEDEGWTPTYELVLWTDDAAKYHDGSVRGAPLPAGYDGHFDWRHSTWRWCFNGTLGIESIFEAYHGARSGHNEIGDSTDSVVPKNATQWTNNLQACRLPPGNGFYFFGDIDSNPVGEFTGNPWGAGVAVLQKTAQTKVPRPSENFARPCGLDRYAIDETRGACVSFVDETDPAAPVVYVPTASDLVEGELVLLDSGTSSDGVWEVVSNGTFLLTLGGKVAELPSNYEPRDGGIFGPIRWPDVPGFCGELTVTDAAQEGSDVVITVSAPANVWVGDSLDFTGVDGLTTTTVTSIVDVTHFKVGGTLGAYSGGGTVVVTGAPSPDWNDDETKGDVIYMVTTHDHRDWQEREIAKALDSSAPCYTAEPSIRENAAGYPVDVTDIEFEQIGPGNGCVPFSVCNPQVFAASPNGEEFPNGLTKEMPTEIEFDSTYGAQWQSQFIQHMVSAFWQVPHESCEGYGTTPWEEDPGTCEVDTSEVRYYPFRPLVEARVDPPAGAPTLPVDYGLLSFDEIHSGSGSGSAMMPAQPPGYVQTSEMPPKTNWTPWGMFLAQKGCVCAGGRFADVYSANFVPCDRICPS